MQVKNVTSFGQKLAGGGPSYEILRAIFSLETFAAQCGIILRSRLGSNNLYAEACKTPFFNAPYVCLLHFQFMSNEDDDLGIATGSTPTPEDPRAIKREDVHVYPSGRVYLENLAGGGCRQLGSITRGKPKNSLAVRCMIHGCSFVWPVRQAPDDETLIDWFACGPLSLPSDTVVQKREMKAIHTEKSKAYRVTVP